MFNLLVAAKHFNRVAIIAILVSLCACNRVSPLKFEGETQGTTYHITVVACAPQPSKNTLQQRVENRLAQIDRALSNYRDDSELAHFNRAPIDEWISLGSDLYAVLQASQSISEQSDGAFDITVAPLVDLWGFGRHRKEGYIPSVDDIAKVRALVDYHQIEIDPAQARARKHVALAIDVNGIAQGYSVDQLANVLDALGCSDYLVEVGGELRLRGHNAERQLWRIGIEKPSDNFADAEQAIRATDVGITTAGDYHEYFEKDGVRYSHTLDPRTGRPIAHALASVTVLAENATLADGWDTALEVMGPEVGFEFAEKNHLAAYFIVREKNHFATRFTRAMEPFLK